MNQQDRKEFEIVHLKIDGLKEDILKMQADMEKAHQKTDENLRFIKENLFNPNEGLWAETKENSQFRQSAGRWRSMIGAGFIGLFFKHHWMHIAHIEALNVLSPNVYKNVASGTSAAHIWFLGTLFPKSTHPWHITGT